MKPEDYNNSFVFLTIKYNYFHNFIVNTRNKSVLVGSIYINKLSSYELLFEFILHYFFRI